MSGILQTVRESLASPSGRVTKEADLEQGVIPELQEREKSTVQEDAKSVQSNRSRKKHVRIAKSSASSRMHGKRATTSSSDWIDVETIKSPRLREREISISPPRRERDREREINSRLLRLREELQRERETIRSSRPEEQEISRSPSRREEPRREEPRREREISRSPSRRERRREREISRSPPQQEEPRREEPRREDPRREPIIIRERERERIRPPPQQDSTISMGERVMKLAAAAKDRIIGNDIKFRATEIVTQRPRSCSPRRANIHTPDFEIHLQEHYESTVFNFDKKPFIVNSASLQRVKLLRLQRLLLEEAFEFKYLTPRGRYDSPTMHNYTQALIDWEYIRGCALRGKMNDPFILTTERARDLTSLMEVGKDWLRKAQYSDGDGYLISKLEEDINRLEILPPPKDEGQPEELFGGSRNVMNREAENNRRLKRLSMATIGGGFLITPMLIMVLHKNLLATLLTTSLFVVAFGLVMVRFGDAPFDVLSGTAAYAAVLVVFVGTSSS